VTLLFSRWDDISIEQRQIFFLGCVIVAGLFGATTTSPRILWVQALPGAIALTLVLLP
jgi:putative membrane protein